MSLICGPLPPLCDIRFNGILNPAEIIDGDSAFLEVMAPARDRGAHVMDSVVWKNYRRWFFPWLISILRAEHENIPGFLNATPHRRVPPRFSGPSGLFWRL